jgi:hypothetical protein
MSSILTARLTLFSTTLFPIYISPAAGLTTATTESISGSSEFSSINIPAASSASIFGPTLKGADQNVVYFYAAAPSTNPSTMSIHLSASSNVFLSTLYPGDFMYLPLRVDSGNIQIKAINSSTTSSMVNVFWGEK